MCGGLGSPRVAYPSMAAMMCDRGTDRCIFDDLGVHVFSALAIAATIADLNVHVFWAPAIAAMIVYNKGTQVCSFNIWVYMYTPDQSQWYLRTHWYSLCISGSFIHHFTVS